MRYLHLHPITTFFFCFCFLPLGAQTDTLRLIFSGDIMGHAPQIKSAETGPNQYDYRPCFRYVKPILERADLAIGNLELTLPGKGPYSGYPMFRSPDALAVALRDAGFDILVTANHHSNASRGPGFGQQSVRERLRSAYGQDISLEMVPGPGGEGTRVTVRMPLQTDTPAPAPAPELSPFGPSRFLP